MVDSEKAEKFLEKFPHLAFSLEEGAPLLRAPLVGFPSGKTETIYLYGLGSGQVYEEILPWLRENPRRKAIFLEEDPKNFVPWLSQESTKTFLEDGQVHLHHLSHLRDLEKIAKQYPARAIECFRAKNQSSSRFLTIQKHLLEHTSMAHALWCDRFYGEYPFYNFLRNARQIPNSFYANALHGKFRGCPALVCGAGPSLAEDLPWIANMQSQAICIAGGSTIAAMSQKGVIPHFGVVIDPNREEYERMQRSHAFEMPLLYSTRVHPDVFTTMSGPFGYLRCGIGGLSDLWLEETLGLTEPLIGEKLSQDAISVTAVTVAFAQFLGCDPIVLCGVDLAYVRDQRYAPGIVSDSRATFSPATFDQRVRVSTPEKGRVTSAVRWVIEGRGLSHFAKVSRPTRFFSTSHKGLAMRHIPYRPLESFATAWPQRPSLSHDVTQAVLGAFFPATMEEKVVTALQTLQESLLRVESQGKILTGEERGSASLAEIELEEELAKDILLYDAHTLFPREERWQGTLDLTRRYLAKFK